MSNQISINKKVSNKENIEFSFWRGSLEEYNSIENPNPDVIYFVYGEGNAIVLPDSLGDNPVTPTPTPDDPVYTFSYGKLSPDYIDIHVYKDGVDLNLNQYTFTSYYAIPGYNAKLDTTNKTLEMLYSESAMTSTQNIGKDNDTLTVDNKSKKRWEVEGDKHCFINEVVDIVNFSDLFDSTTQPDRTIYVPFKKSALDVDFTQNVTVEEYAQSDMKVAGNYNIIGYIDVTNISSFVATYQLVNSTNAGLALFYAYTNSSGTVEYGTYASATLLKDAGGNIIPLRRTVVSTTIPSNYKAFETKTDDTKRTLQDVSTDRNKINKLYVGFYEGSDAATNKPLITDRVNKPAISSYLTFKGKL